ncbi:MAG TPA: protein phosphatase 2C domain-containing protein [Sandaracinaceae bacterium LLY-WYZ-13_1]|nr:protein phosphatase 2C domain-containing protein [Sandaracinaceae bacterium LLY-WYZ-13_1]
MIQHTQVSLACFGGGHDRAGVFGAAHHKLLVVADGAGGASGAAQAAELVVDVVGETAARMEGPLGPTGLRALLERLDRLLLSSRHAGQSTAVLVEVMEDAFWGVSVGDSGAWLVHDGHHLDLTHAQHRKWRLGTGFATPVQFGPLPLVGTLLLGTDGLFECATPDRLEDAVGEIPLSDVAGTLVERVRLPDGGFRDDLAIVLCRREGWQTRAVA